MKRAFTLIELLVVIAIIAILAAILFPVFAQAKASAKGSASLSNDKQQALAVLMYSNDSDDMAVLDTAWGGGYPIWYGVQNSDFAPWTYLIAPYMKNTAIFADPLGKGVGAPAPGWPADLWNAYNEPEYGYDYTVFCPSYFGNLDAHNHVNRFPISMTAPARPADTVLLTQHTDPGEAGYGWWYGIGTILTTYGSDPVDCHDINPACFMNWGLNTPFDGASGMKDYVSGAITGFSAPRRADHLVTTMADGHAKAFATAQLGEGTNYSPTTQSSAIAINNLNVYHWTAQ